MVVLRNTFREQPFNFISLSRNWIPAQKNACVRGRYWPFVSNFHLGIIALLLVICLCCIRRCFKKRRTKKGRGTDMKSVQLLGSAYKDKVRRHTKIQMVRSASGSLAMLMQGPIIPWRLRIKSLTNLFLLSDWTMMIFVYLNLRYLSKISSLVYKFHQFYL